MRSLLLHAHRDANFPARLKVAIELACACDAHLTLLQAIAFDVLMPGDFYGATVADMLPVAKADAEAFRAEVEPQLAAAAVRWDWVDEIGLADMRMLQHAALADLAIVGASAPDGARGPSPLAGILAVHARAPVLVVPDGASGIDLSAPAALCWDGSLEASRALRAALPLLARAASVHLLCVTEDGDAEEDADLPSLDGAAYLHRHGIAAELVPLPRTGKKVHQMLREAARARGAGLVVMGAYGQPRLFETLFGGTTRAMLTDPPVPLLLAH